MVLEMGPCNNESKGFIDIESELYEVKETVLRALIAIMIFSGILTVLSNMAVIFFGLRRRRLFPTPILSLAFTDLLTGILATPLVIAIYYTSECHVKNAGPPFFSVPKRKPVFSRSELLLHEIKFHKN